MTKKIPNKKVAPFKKEPRVEKTPSATTGYLVWHIGVIDMYGESWGWDKIDKDLFFKEIVPKLQNFESMTWGEILNRQNHEIDISEICPEARKRLSALNLDDYDKLISLRLTGPQRVWGIRNKDILKLLWWDPEHKVYPSFKKHT